ncbi:sugar phosphate isomerase/epimerase [Blastopirellula sp. JC732]|uniref:Sugar phosphate isomerase/epimerase n=1 Tax=Blastopirellula sediminis TaxID=2894196 RepID=A0A9X1MTC9_9BACT|nr:sugar phosphate isomerase/epimerase family protein [Blastopirellula sediminis]MCC9604457.1 sugar phosphate isomerase/epimerase [Blastopirellula sediminis]MCC9632244.1 sugar phosphate isomerase/epimerase [Blastopirellula sediminis]
MAKWPLGVFASIDAGLGVQLSVVEELGVPTIQLHAPAKESRTADNAAKFLAKLESIGVTLTCVFGGFEGESYADIPTTKETVGLVPPATRAERLAEMKEIADFARVLDCDVVGLHVGFIPHDKTDPMFGEVVAVTQELCDHCQGNEQYLHLETGQESAEGLLGFIAAVDRPNLRVNFDPANMILYGTGNPIEALKAIGKHVGSVHCKDAKWSDQPGVTWGTEMPLGQGDVGMEEFLRTVKEIGYTGPLTIEREIPQEPERQKAEIGAALELLTALRTKIG